MLHASLDPFRFAGGYVQLLPHGRCVIVFDPLPEDADDEWRAIHRRCVAAIDLLGHQVIVGDVADLAMAISEAER